MRAICFFVLLVLAGCASTAGAPKFTQHYSGTFFKITENTRFSVEMIVKDVDLNVGMNSFDIIIHNSKDRDVEDAEIKIVPWMPKMGHGVQSEPVITSKGRGLYHVEDLEANMPGYWEFKVFIKAGGEEDSVVFDFPSIKPKEESE